MPFSTASPPIATDDVSSGNTPGDPVTLNILTNDALGDGTSPVPPGDVVVNLDETSVPGGVLNPDGSVTVPGEGTWSYDDTTGDLTFTPEAGFIDDPTAHRLHPDRKIDRFKQLGHGDRDGGGSAAGGHGRYRHLHAGQPQRSHRHIGQRHHGRPGGSDHGDPGDDGSAGGDRPVRPPTVTAIVLEMTVPGEGVWTVDETTGATVFTPCADGDAGCPAGGFTGDPTPITYTVEDAQGNPDSATITLTADPLPVATDDVETYTPGSPSDPVDILANDTTGDPVVPTTVTLETTGLPGTSTCTNEVDGDCLEMTVPGEGVWTVDETTGATVFTPVRTVMPVVRRAVLPAIRHPSPIRWKMPRAIPTAPRSP